MPDEQQFLSPHPASANADQAGTQTDASRARSQCCFQNKSRAWDAPLDDYGLAYFNILAADYKAMTPAPPHPAGTAPADPRATEMCEAREQIQILLAGPANEITWADLLIMEASLGKLWSMERLNHELSLLRGEYKDLIGVEAYAALQLPVINFAAVAENRSMRAEYQTFLREIHWSYISAPAKESRRGYFLVWLTVSLALLLITLLMAGHDPVFGAIIICGAIGAWLSAFQRLQSPASKTIILLNLRRTKLAGLSFFLSPWIGALCAVILSLIFAGGIIGGKFFPVVRYTDHLDAGSTNMIRSAALPMTNSPVISTNPATAVATNRAPLQWHEHGRQKWHFGADTEFALLLV